MRPILYYTAANPNGSSGQIVRKLNETLIGRIVTRNVADAPDLAELGDYDLVIILVATYGDQELQDQFEEFLIPLGASIDNKKFVLCEIGNYYGYDDFTFGSGIIVERYLSSRRGIKYAPLFSIDTLPRIDWSAVEIWIKNISNILQEKH